MSSVTNWCQEVAERANSMWLTACGALGHEGGRVCKLYVAGCLLRFGAWGWGTCKLYVAGCLWGLGGGGESFIEFARSHQNEKVAPYTHLETPIPPYKPN